MKKTSAMDRLRTWAAKTINPKQESVGLRRFAAARIDRLTADWITTESSINEELRSDLNRLRMRGRELINNNDYAKKFAGMCADNIVGPNGFRLQSRVEDQPGKPDGLANNAIESAFMRWAERCDITGRQSFRDLCETVIKGMPSDGEFLVRMVRGASAKNPFNFALQLIDVDRIDTTMNLAKTANTNAVIMGVEVDDFKTPVALHIFAAHPSDGIQSSRQRIRVPLNDIIHAFRVERAEQMRGIPWMAPGMLSLHHLANFKLAAILAAEHGANHYGFFFTEDGAAPVGQQEVLSGETVTTSQPGVFDTLPMGVKFQQYDSKYPNEVFAPFVKSALQRLASGWRVSYHSLANDLEGVNFSSIRSGVLEERDRWATDQAWFIDSFLNPVYYAWLQMALLSKAIVLPNGSALPLSKMDKFTAHQWQGRRWEWVDPEKDMIARTLAVKAGLMAPQDIAAQLGTDFDDNIAKIAQANQLAKTAGVALPAYESMPGVQPNSVDSNKSD